MGERGNSGTETATYYQSGSTRPQTSNHKEWPGAQVVSTNHPLMMLAADTQCELKRYQSRLACLASGATLHEVRTL